MDPSPPLDADRLLEHAAWVRHLAGRLLSDPNSADDAAQDAYATALTTGPREASRTRAWFAAVVRHFVRRAQRSVSLGRDEGRAATRAAAEMTPRGGVRAGRRPC